MVEKGSTELTQYSLELVTPEMVKNRKSAFLKTIALGETPEQKMELGVKHVLGDLFNRYERVSIVKLCVEIQSILNILYVDRANVEVGIDIENYLRILFSRDQTFSLFKKWGILEKVKYYSPETHSKLNLGQLQDDLSLQENIGGALSQLPKTKQLVLDADNSIPFVLLDECERGLVGLLVLKGMPTVLKRTNLREDVEVLKFCGEKGLSPVIYESTPECVAEEFIDAPKINSFKKNPEMVGQAIGVMAGLLHREGVVYDNRFLDHTCIEITDKEHGKAKTRIIDLEGASFSTDFEVDIKNIVSELKASYPENEKSLEKAIENFKEYHCKTLRREKI